MSKAQTDKHFEVINTIMGSLKLKSYISGKMNFSVI
jgi:hypothetical protein